MNIHPAKLGALLTALMSNPDMLAALAKQANVEAKPSKAAYKAAKENAPLASKEERVFAFEQATMAAFKKAGFGDVIPRQDVLTWGKWEEKGFQVKADQRKAYVRVKTRGMKGKGIMLYHKSQVEAVAAPKLAEVLA